MKARGRTRPPALTPDESRLLDGALPPAEAARLERLIASDPDRADALAVDRGAMDLWREEARAASAVDSSTLAPEELAERVVATLDPRARGARPISTAYAVAAMLLIGIGLVGTAAARAARVSEARAQAAPRASIEAALLDSIADEVLMFPRDFGLPADQEGR